MKRLRTLLLFVIICIHSYAQQKVINQPVSGTSQPSRPDRCATDIHLEQSVKQTPAYQKTITEANRLLNQEVKRRIDLSFQRRTTVQSPLPVTIPVVIHIVLPDPAAITDAMVQYQIDKLNSDFSGLNPDSSNLLPMYPYSLRGHANIRFVLARRDTKNNFTTGVERRCSNTNFTTEDADPIKLSQEGGLDAWDTDRYLNIWVGNTMIQGLLGYSTYP